MGNNIDDAEGPFNDIFESLFFRILNSVDTQRKFWIFIKERQKKDLIISVNAVGGAIRSSSLFPLTIKWR